MAGALARQMAGQPPQEEAAPVEQNPLAEQDETAPEQDPAYLQAVQFIRAALYKDGAAERVNAIMQKAGPGVSEQLATLAYELAQKADEVTDGNIEDENLVSLAVFALAEVVEIAEASGAPLEPADMASALKAMMLRYLSEAGAPPEQIEQLQAAMNQIKPEEFNQMANQAAGEPQQGAAPAEDESNV